MKKLTKRNKLTIPVKPFMIRFARIAAVENEKPLTHDAAVHLHHD